MKHLTAILMVCHFCFTSISFAQVVGKVNPGGLLLGAGSASLEWFPAYRFSVLVDGYVMPGTTLSGLNFSGGGAGISGRFYATSAARPTGLFVSPMVAQHWVSFRDIRSIEHQYNYSVLGGQLGYQMTFNQKITLELGGGIWTGLNVPTIKQAFGVKEYYGEGLNYWLNISLGIVLWSR